MFRQFKDDWFLRATSFAEIAARERSNFSAIIQLVDQRIRYRFGST